MRRIPQGTEPPKTGMLWSHFWETLVLSNGVRGRAQGMLIIMDHTEFVFACQRENRYGG
jgi:hypothetical protein